MTQFSGAESREFELKYRIIEKVNHAAKTNNLELIHEYIRLKGNLNIQDEKGYTPLIFAAYYGNEEMVELLLKNKANPCVKDKRGNTALMGAIFKGNLSIAYKLMNSECAIHQKNNANQTALMYASLFNRKELARELIAKGQNPKFKDNHGVSAIDVAKKQYNNEMVELLTKQSDRTSSKSNEEAYQEIRRRYDIRK
ncbi:ankyrin repeat domain-containing protein [Bacteriovorax sp. DB6_IX]|uniref:ankyrin repeat domain-containing protein n=1 Tax=Bacteriovorax sp. DB6_IX TaxID=1353530 RepID=UPI00038A1B69|nr:ankyrin repeat domain-containing protein [Bacteriovorax sp. DB6_IX]EQC51580.1 ankyrin repeat protein [Bacteriovorax sp. DB6_IX]